MGWSPSQEDAVSQTTFLLLAIVLAAFVVGLSVVLSLAHVQPPAPGRRDAVGVPAKILCPVTGGIARVEIGFHPVGRGLAVLRCEHFPTGVIACERGCFPALDYTRTPAVSRSVA